jgi:two-component system, NtrC family, sensor kinase
MKQPRHHVLHIFFSLILFLYPLNIKAQDTLVYTADQTLTDVGQYVYFYKDETNALTFEQIKNLPDSAFHKSKSSPLRFGITTASVWLKFAVKNQTESPLFLAFQSNALSALNAYIYDEAGKLTEKDAFNDKEPHRANIILNLGTSPKFLYVKIRSDFSLQLPLVLSRLAPMSYHYYKLDVKNGLCLGILIAMALYNLFIFFLVKDRLYLYYCLYILTSLWTMAHLSGLGLLIWGDYPLLTRFVGVPLVLLSAWLFTIRFLNLDKNMPRIYIAIKILCFLIACIIPIDFLNLQVIRGMAQQLLTPISTISMLIVGIVSHFQGNKSAKYYVFAWSFFLVGGIITSLSYGNKLPYTYFTSNAVLFGACIESILLAFALANRINIYRAESEKAQALAVQRLEENERLAREQNKSLAENERLVREQNKVLEEKVHERTTELETSLETLKATQNQLIQSEKLANLGELTAGISHEIQNPLNFVTNFSELSVDLVKDLKDELAKPTIDKAYIDELFADLASNQEKIKHHGRRASSIVKGMLEHSRASTGIREHIDINQLADEYLRLSYHGLRAKDKTFNAEFKTDFADSLPKIAVIPQDLGRVLLNLINNAFYAVNQRQQHQHQQQLSKSLKLLESYTPTVTVTTQQIDNQIIIKVKDNGTGMPESVKVKIFQPFFSTKPTGEGTGLGLSLAYDIVTKGHGGKLAVESTEGIGTTFTLTLST